MREPASCGCWREAFIHSDKAQALDTAAESVASGHSVLLLDALATAAECDKILRHSSEAAEVQREACDPGCRVNPGRVRMPVVSTPALEPARDICEMLLLRALEVVEFQLPQLHTTLFSDLGHSTECMNNPRFTFSDSEPAINVYRAGGHFERHQDSLPVP